MFTVILAYIESIGSIKFEFLYAATFIIDLALVLTIDTGRKCSDCKLKNIEVIDIKTRPLAERK